MTWRSLIWRVLRGRRIRTAFSIVSVALGVTVYVAVSIGARNLSTAIRTTTAFDDESLADLAPVGAFDATAPSRAEEFFAGVEDAIAPLGGAALFVAGYLIFLTLMRDAQDQARAHATMRVLGASPRQVGGLIFAEAATAAILGTAAGLIFGVLGGGGVAEAMRQIFGLSVAGVPTTTPGDIIAVGVALGLGVPLLAALMPAVRAARTDPVHGLRSDHTSTPDSTRNQRLVLGVILVGVGAVALSVVPNQLRWLAVLMVLGGAALVLPTLAAPVARGVLQILARISPGASELAAQDLSRRTGHSAATMGLLAVTLALTVMVATISASQRPEFIRVLDAHYGTDGTIHFPGGAPLTDDQFATLQALPAVDAVTPQANGRVRVDTNDTGVKPLTVIDPDTYFDTADLAWTQGTDADRAVELLRAGGAVAMATSIADDAGLGTGDTVTLATSTGPLEFTVAGLFNALGYGETVTVVMPRADATAALGYQGPTTVLANINTDLSELERQLGDSGLPGAFTAPNDAIRSEILSQFDGINGLIIVILIITATIGVLGLANTLLIDTRDRLREIGIMRAVGGDARDVTRLILTRSLILTATASLGAVILGGLLGAALITSNDSSLGLAASYRFPTVTTAAVLGLAAVVGVSAAIQPARRANKLNPSIALRTTER